MEVTHTAANKRADGENIPVESSSVTWVNKGERVQSEQHPRFVIGSDRSGCSNSVKDCCILFKTTQKTRIKVKQSESTSVINNTC